MLKGHLRRRRSFVGHTDHHVCLVHRVVDLCSTILSATLYHTGNRLISYCRPLSITHSQPLSITHSQRFLSHYHHNVSHCQPLPMTMPTTFYRTTNHFNSHTFFIMLSTVYSFLGVNIQHNF